MRRVAFIMLTLSCHPLNVAIEKFDKRTHRRIDRRERKAATLTVRVGNGESHLTVKSAIHNDVWMNREVVVLEDDKFVSFTFKEHNQVLVITKPHTSREKEEALRGICAALRKSVDSKQGVSVAAYVPPHQAVHPPTPELPPAPKKTVFSPTKQMPPPHRSLFQSPPSKSSGLTPTQKKARPGSPPFKQMPRSSPIKTSPSKASPSRPPLKQEELTVTQRAALSACLAGHNVFLTGGAGTGKSSLVALIVERMRRQHGEDAVFVTATTGLAACAIGGSTLHNFAGIGGLFHEGDDMNKAVQEVLNKVVAVKRWRTCKVLVLEEVSMLSGSFLELVDLIGQRCRGNSKTLGGVQLVICGDFFQLPPISSKGTAPISFAFQSPVWAKCKFTNIVLDRVFRQSDSTFIALLEAVRRGELSPEGLALLNQRVGRDVHDHASGVVATKILTHKADVDRCNDAELSHLAGEAHEYVASDSGEQKHAKFLDDYCPAKKSLKLKLRAQVILLKTIEAEKGLVNGARGIVVGFGAAPSHRPLVRFAPAASSGLPVLERTIGLEAFTTQSGGTVLATRMQLPLAGGWALSVHRSQGMSVDRAELHLSGVFEVGQAYVALSRVRTIEGLRLASPLLQGHIKVHAAVKSFYASIEERSHSDSQL